MILKLCLRVETVVGIGVPNKLLSIVAEDDLQLVTAASCMKKPGLYYVIYYVIYYGVLRTPHFGTNGDKLPHNSSFRDIGRFFKAARRPLPPLWAPVAPPGRVTSCRHFWRRACISPA